MNKDLIKKRFSGSLKTYDDNAKVQKKMAEHLISLSDKTKFNSILEIGCGSGTLTKAVVERFEFKKYSAVDIAGGCQKFISEISPDIKFLQADIEDIVKNSPEKYDLIISNASFQWIENVEELISNLISKLNKNGVLLFSTFGAENFREIFFVLGKTLPYKSVGEYEQILKNIPHRIEEEIHVLAFKTPKDVLKHIKLTGANAIYETNWTKHDMQKFENGYNNFCSGTPTLSYNPIYIKINN